MTDTEKQQLNSAAAREVMKWRGVPGDGFMAWYGGEGEVRFTPYWDQSSQLNWNPLESWADCGRLLEKMAADGWWYTLDVYPGGGATVRFWNVATQVRSHGSAPTPQEAILRAALEAVRSMKPPQTQDADAAGENKGEE